MSKERKMPKVSVVIPCYNVEKYIRQCLDSVVKQTLSDIEIICVNDGSTDSTLSILQEYAKTDGRIHIISKENSGYGCSMNIGFDAAEGEYLGIVESDDYADPDMFEKLYDLAKKHDLDVAKSGYCLYYSVPEECNEEIEIASEIMCVRTFCPVCDFPAIPERVEFFNIKPTIWSAIYRKQFIRENDIRFNETPGASYQDASFNFKVWAMAKRVRLMRDCFLHYRQDNEASSIHSPGKVYCICDEYDEMERFLNKHQLIKGILDPVKARIQYDSYMWNYARLDASLQEEFLVRFKEDFLRLQSQGLLMKEYFESYKWRDLMKIINGDSYADLPVDMKKKKREAILKDKSMLISYLYRFYFCLEDNGWKYTIRHFFRRVESRLS